MQVRVDDVRLFFDVEGAGLIVDGLSMRQRPTHVLLHGGPGFDHTVFRPSYSQLADTAQVAYLDLRGRSWERQQPASLRICCPPRSSAAETAEGAATMALAGAAAPAHHPPVNRESEGGPR